MTLAIRAGDPLSKSSHCAKPPYFPLHLKRRPVLECKYPSFGLQPAIFKTSTSIWTIFFLCLDTYHVFVSSMKKTKQKNNIVGDTAVSLKEFFCFKMESMWFGCTLCTVSNMELFHSKLTKANMVVFNISGTVIQNFHCSGMVSHFSDY